MIIESSCSNKFYEIIAYYKSLLSCYHIILVISFVKIYYFILNTYIKNILANYYKESVNILFILFVIKII